MSKKMIFVVKMSQNDYYKIELSDKIYLFCKIILHYIKRVL